MLLIPLPIIPKTTPKPPKRIPMAFKPTPIIGRSIMGRGKASLVNPIESRREHIPDTVMKCEKNPAKAPPTVDLATAPASKGGMIMAKNSNSSGYFTWENMRADNTPTTIPISVLLIPIHHHYQL